MTRAETTTATTEDIQTLDARWFERWETEQPLADKYAGYYQGRVSAVAQCREELRRLLATARTRPTREQVTAAIGDAANSMQIGFGVVSIAAAVDAVLALWADQPTAANTTKEPVNMLNDPAAQ